MGSFTLRQLIKYWQDYMSAGQFVTRELSDYSNTLDKFILAFIGVRRSGKSTLAYLTAQRISKKKFLYINFEDVFFIENNRISIFDELIAAFTELNACEPELLIFDEIQNIPHWEKWARQTIDTRRYKLIITGSSAKMLSSEIATSLTGRCIEQKIYPLSFIEYLQFKELEPVSEIEAQAHFKQFLIEGGFPAAVLETSEITRKTILMNYLQDLLHKDVISRYEIRNVAILNALTQYYLTNISSTHSHHRIKNFLECNLDTVRDYSHYLQSAFLFFELPRYHHNLKTQIRDPRKIYCIDTGLRNANAFYHSEDLGKLAENAVFVELLRSLDPCNKLFYFKNEDCEVDFLVVEGFRIKQAIQVSWSDLSDKRIRDRELKALRDIAGQHQVDRLTMVVSDSSAFTQQELARDYGLDPNIFELKTIWEFCGLTKSLKPRR